MKKQKIFISTIILVILTFISKFIGSFRDALVSNYFGGNEISDVYNFAITLPESIFGIIGLTISAIFIPLLSQVLYEDGKEKQHKFASNIITIIFIISIILFFIGIIFTKNLVEIFAPGFYGNKLQLSILLIRITMINIVFLSLNGIFTAILQVSEDFIIPSLLGLVFNIPIIGYILITNDLNIIGLTIANVFGNLFRVLVQIPSLKKNGYSLKPYINLQDKRLIAAIKTLIPIIIAAGCNSINILVDTNITSKMGNSFITALTSANRILSFANASISTCIISIMFPLLTNKLNHKDKNCFGEMLQKSLIIILLFLIPIGFSFIILRVDIVNLFIGYGEFLQGNAISITSIALIGCGIQLPFLGARDLLNASLFSMKKTKIAALNSVISIIFNIFFSIILSKRYGILGVTLGSAIGTIISSALMLYSISKYVNYINFYKFFYKTINLFIASSIMSIIVMLLHKFFINNLIIITSIGAIIYFVICYILKIEEINEIILFINYKIKKLLSIKKY